jgi:penicillin-binding protein 1A
VPAGAASDASGATGSMGPGGMTPPGVTSSEKQQIMDLFETNKP